MDVTSWSATVSTSYAVTTDFGLNGDSLHYTVDQSSSGTALLTRTSTSPAGDSTVWEGIVSGTAHVNNKSIQKSGNPLRVIGTSTDVGDGPQQPLLAHVRFAADWSAADGCRYAIRYQDDLSYHHAETPSTGTDYTIPFTTAIVADKFVLAGPKPTAGWQLDVTRNVPGLLFPAGQDVDDELTNLGARQYYVPFPPVSASMLQLAPNNQLGTATFKYVLVAH
jgi:hypothetical protein